MDLITTIAATSTVVAIFATMPQLRGLKLLETIDVYGPLTVTEIARITGQDKSWVSRIVRACEADGWVVRDGGRIAMGPRAALLGASSTAAEVIRSAQPLVEAVAGITGLVAQAYALIGTRATVIAAAGGGSQMPSAGIGMATSLLATAAGQVIAAQLDDQQLQRLVPDGPFPDALVELLTNPGFLAFATGRFVSVADSEPSIPDDREQLMRRLEHVREHGVAIDRGDLHPQIGCIAVPWVGVTVPAALACVGSPAEISAAEQRARTVLEAAAAPGATREDVVAAAAARHYSVAP